MKSGSAIQRKHYIENTIFKGSRGQDSRGQVKELKFVICLFYSNPRTLESSNPFKDNKGISAVIVAVMITALIGFAALALDIGHLMVVRGELQNAADAGALAGARVLIIQEEDGDVIVNTNANLEAYNAAIANNSDNDAVEINFGNGNDLDVRRGRWDEDTLVFYDFENDPQYDSLDPFYNNAVKVTARRSAAYSIFATIFGKESFPASATAIAYRGHSGENVVYDQPLALCRDRLTDSEGNFLCTMGRMINNGSSPETGESARWTNFSEGCADPASTKSITDLICETNAPVSLVSISTINGEVTPALLALYDCWEEATNKTVPWELTLPVIECVTPPECSTIVGAVRVKVVWFNDNGSDPQFNNIPVSMEGWSQASNCSGYDLTKKDGRRQCWLNFANYFNLKYIDASGVPKPAGYMPSTIYFVPECDFQMIGGPGGDRFNMYSLYPKLVK